MEQQLSPTKDLLGHDKDSDDGGVYFINPKDLEYDRL